MRMTPWTVLVCTLTVLVVGFLAYRMVRPMNIFVVSEAFERPIAEIVPSGLTSLSARAPLCGVDTTTTPSGWRWSLTSTWETSGTGVRAASVGLTNIGADHHLPTGTPDHHLTLTFKMRDHAGNVLKEKDHALKRTILW